MIRLGCTLLLMVVLVSCGEQKARGNYEEAKMLVEAGDVPQAIAFLRRAADCACSDSLQASIQSAIGHLLFETGMENEAFEAFSKAYEADVQQSDSLGMALDLRDMGNVCRTKEQDDSCLVYYNKALILARKLSDNSLVANICSQLAGYYLWHKRYDEAHRLLMPALSGAYGVPDAGIRFMAADYYRHDGPSDSAWHYCLALTSEEDIGHRQMGHKWVAEMLLEEGKVKEAAQHLAKFEALTDSLMVETDMEAVRRVNALYDYSQQAANNARLRYYVVVAVAVIIVLILLSLTAMLYFSRRRFFYLVRLQKLEQLLAEYRQLDEEKAKRQQVILGDTPIYHRIIRLLSDSHPKMMNDEDWHILEDTIAKTHPGFIDRLWEFRKLSPQETRISLLLKMGICPSDIARLIGRSKQSISSARSRLYEKVFGQKGTPAQWDEFIQSL